MKHNTNKRGVSPVIGVILMVAVTVILAAVIGVFVLDLAGNTEDNVKAGVTMDATTSGMEVQWVSGGNAESISVRVDGTEKAVINNVGGTATVNVPAGGTVTAVGSNGDVSTTLMSQTADQELGNVLETLLWFPDEGTGDLTTTNINASDEYVITSDGDTVKELEYALEDFNADTSQVKVTINLTSVESVDITTDAGTTETVTTTGEKTFTFNVNDTDSLKLTISNETTDFVMTELKIEETN